jgi:N-acetylneuraminic acid mutarotase
MIPTLVFAAFITAAWQRLPDLPRAVGGLCAGVGNGALLVIGGSYFAQPYFEGGQKVWVDTVYVLEPGARRWKTLRAPQPVASAACVTASDGVIVVGGTHTCGNITNAYRLVYRDSNVSVHALPNLPEPLANAAAAVVGRAVYIAGGQESPASTRASRHLWMLDLSENRPHWRRLEDCPGSGRILPVFSAYGGSLYLASGAELRADSDGRPVRRYLRDAWRYQPGSGWRAMRPAPTPMVAAPLLSRVEAIYVFGGDDGENAAHVQKLKDDHPGFRRRITAWKPEDGTWTDVAEYPAGLVTSMAVAWNGQLIIAGGEDRPGHRSASVSALKLEALP